MTNLRKQIREVEIVPGARVFIAPRKTKDVVTIEGSVIGGKSLVSEYKTMTPWMTAELLDAGTKTKTKDALRETLASRGASLSFTARGERTYFYASCLPEDLAVLLKIIAECLGESVFPKEELETVRKIALGELADEKSDTKIQAATALSRAVYDPEHPNFLLSTAVRERSASGIERKDITQYAKNLGGSSLIMAIVGDVTEEAALKALQSFKRLPKGTPSIPEKPANAKKQSPKEEHIHIPNKANIDVYFGASIPLTVRDPRYIPFTFMSDMLGGRGFSGHLFSTIREREGLTYGIYALHSGFEDGRDGMFRIWATFSPDTFRKAVDLTHKEMRIFLKEKLTRDAVEEQKGRLIGRYLLGLSSTSGLASTLHTLAREGRELSFLDTYPDLIERMTLEEVAEAGSLVPLDALTVVAAGTFADRS